MKYFLIIFFSCISFCAYSQSFDKNFVLNQHYIKEFNRAVDSMTYYQCRASCAYKAGDTVSGKKFMHLHENWFEDAKIWFNFRFPTKKHRDSILNINQGAIDNPFCPCK